VGQSAASTADWRRIAFPTPRESSAGIFAEIENTRPGNCLLHA
jgi:hypothetical protein